MKSKEIQTMKRGTFKTFQGWCAAAWTKKGLAALILPQKSPSGASHKLMEYLPPMPTEFWNRPRSPVPKEIRDQVQKALGKKSVLFKKSDLYFLTPFQQRVLKATCEIPWGQTRSYAWVARRAGSPRGFRAAGQALNRNPVPLLIPCHRVVASGSHLGGYGGGIDWKIRLLRDEGVEVRKGTDGSYRVS